MVHGVKLAYDEVDDGAGVDCVGGGAVDRGAGGVRELVPLLVSRNVVLAPARGRSSR